MYCSIIKLKQSAKEKRLLSGHVISFRQDSIEKLSTILPDIESTKEDLKVVFVGPTEKSEINRTQATISCYDLQVRSNVIYAWLKLLKAINPNYKDVIIDKSDSTKTAINGLTKYFMDSADTWTSARMPMEIMN
jgi:hypothetical protein